MSKEWLEPLHWENEGSKPSETLQKRGFTAGDKPPADLFNYFLSQGEKCIKELQKEKINTSHKITDSTAAYKKSVIEQSAKYAKIKEVCGMTRKCTNLWKPLDGATVEGVTMSVDENGVVTLNGTCTASHNFIGSIQLKAGTYYLSDSAVGVFPNDDNVRMDIVGGDIRIRTWNTSPSDYVSVSTITEEAYYNCRIRIQEGHTYDNCKLYPMLSIDEAIPFEPYFEGLRATKVTAIESNGTNLFDVSQIPTNSHIENNGDGTITVKSYGMSTGKTLRQVCPDLKAGDVATLIMDTNGMPFIYLYGIELVWDIGSAITITEEHLNSKICLYCGNSNIPATLSNIRITVGENKDYTPYVKETKEIPEEIRNLDGYGEGIDSDYCNKIVFGENPDFKRYRQYVARVFLGSLDWTLNASGTNVYWWNATLPNCKAPSVNTEIGKIIAGYYKNRVAAGMSSSFAGEIALDVGGVLRCNTGSNTDKPRGYLVYVLQTPVDIDISKIFTDDSFISAVSNGTITMVNEYESEVPSIIEFYSDNHEYLSANKFIGNLDGTAANAEHAEKTSKLIVSPYITNGNAPYVYLSENENDGVAKTGLYAVIFKYSGYECYTSLLFVRNFEDITYSYVGAFIDEQRVTATVTCSKDGKIEAHAYIGDMKYGFSIKEVVRIASFD